MSTVNMLLFKRKVRSRIQPKMFKKWYSYDTTVYQPWTLTSFSFIHDKAT